MTKLMREKASHILTAQVSKNNAQEKAALALAEANKDSSNIVA